MTTHIGETEIDPDDNWSWTRPGARRSLTLCALGAVVGLAIAGLGLFTAKGTRLSSVPAEDVAVVNGVPILMSDYIAQIAALYARPLAQATPEERRKVLDDMLREELYVQRGIELGTQNDTVEVRTALVGATEAQVSADAQMSQPTDGELRAWFAAHVDTYASEGMMTLADYVLPAGSDATSAARATAALRSGASFPGLRRSGVMTDGEEFYFAARIHLGDRLFAAARKLRDGQVSDPVTIGNVPHILVMQHHVAPVPDRLDNVRDRVLADLLADRAKTLLAANDRFLRKRADIIIAKGFE